MCDQTLGFKSRRAHAYVKVCETGSTCENGSLPPRPPSRSPALLCVAAPLLPPDLSATTASLTPSLCLQVDSEVLLVKPLELRVPHAVHHQRPRTEAKPFIHGDASCELLTRVRPPTVQLRPLSLALKGFSSSRSRNDIAIDLRGCVAYGEHDDPQWMVLWCHEHSPRVRFQRAYVGIWEVGHQMRRPVRPIGLVFEERVALAGTTYMQPLSAFTSTQGIHIPRIDGRPSTV